MSDGWPPQQPDRNDRPLDYPEDAGLPPPVYPTPHPGLPGSGYHTPYLGYPAYPANPSYFPPPGTNGKAIAALVCSVAGVLCCLSSPIAVVLGLVAMGETKRTGQNGRGLALAAVSIGGLTIAAWVAYILVHALVTIDS